MQMPIESLNLQMLNVGLARHDSDWNWQQVSSPFTRIYYVTEGSARLHLPREVVELKPGHLYIIPAYTMHSYECRGMFAHYYLHVFEGFKKETDVFELYDLPTEVDADSQDGWLMGEMCRRHPEAQLPESDPRSYDNTTKFTDYVRRYNDLPLYEKMQLRGAILMLFSRFMKQAKPKEWTHDERLKRVLHYIRKNIDDNISIDALAKVAFVTKSYLIQLFKHEFGISPLQYMNKKRIERAQLLLLTEDLTVKEIAYELGFSDHSYFIRLFRKITGVTPQSYRRAPLNPPEKGRKRTI